MEREGKGSKGKEKKGRNGRDPAERDEIWNMYKAIYCLLLLLYETQEESERESSGAGAGLYLNLNHLNLNYLNYLNLNQKLEQEESLFPFLLLPNIVFIHQFVQV